MDRLQELREKRAKLWEHAKAFLENKRDEKTGLVPVEDHATYEKMEDDVVALGDEITKLERQQVHDASVFGTNDKPILCQPMANNGVTNAYFGMRGHITTLHGTAQYEDAFWNAMRKKLIATNDLSVGTDSLGGYLVPDEFHRRIVEQLEEYNIMRKLVRIIRTSNGNLQIPIASSRGTAAWVDEAGKIPTSDSEFGQVTLSAYKLATMIKVSHELLTDSAFPLESFLAKDFGRRMGTMEEEAFLVGDGIKKPTGVLESAQIGVTTEYATEITFEDVMDLYHSLKSPYRNSAVFIANDLTIKALRKLKDSNGQFLWNPSVVAATPDTVLGRPIYVSGYMPQIGAGAKAMAFGDFSFYWIADRKGRTFERLNEIFADTDQVGFKATQRVDGKLTLPEAVKVLQMSEGS